jgi:thiamine pyrophosphokinase
MSSHHIVREKQEPALLILGLDDFADELLGQLLEWSPTLITTPLIAEKLISSGIKIDWIVTNDVDGELQSDLKYLPVNDNGVTASSLEYLITQGYPAVNIVTDELALNQYLAFAAQINLVIFHDGQKIYAINTGFSKWKPAGEAITLLSNPTGLKTTGLEKISDTHYKTLTDGLFSLQFTSPFLFIAESL